jgi:hypothetical protein
MSDSDKISDLVKDKICLNTGELKLDHVQAKMLVNWLLSVEKTLAQQNVLVNKLTLLLDGGK